MGCLKRGYSLKLSFCFPDPHTMDGILIQSCIKICIKVEYRPNQRRLEPGKETLEGFFQVGNQKEYQNVVIISFVHLEKVNIFCFMHKSVAQKLSLPCPFESQTLNSHKSANFKARDFSFWI